MQKRTTTKAGLSPGELIYIGDKKDEQVKIQIIDYTRDNVVESEVHDIAECLEYAEKRSITWINITGIHDTELIAKIGSRLSLHPLALEDIVNSHQRPKIEDFEQYLFIVLKMLYMEKSSQAIVHEQVSLIVAPSYIISFQTLADDVFEPVRQRIKRGKSRLRSRGSDYLAYALIDTVVDNYFLVLEELGDKIDVLDDKAIVDPHADLLQEIQQLKKEVLYIHKSTRPLKEIVNALLKNESPIIHDDTLIFLKDVQHHTVQVTETVEIYRDMLSNILDIYLTRLNNSMSEVMKVLTIMATIFIPLTFIAGIYGMNFEWMPELKWRWAYPVLLGSMGMIVILMLMWFKRNKWIGK